MARVARLIAGSLGALLLAAMTACGSGSNSAPPASLRMVNATSDSITETLNGGAYVSGQATHSSSAYSSLTAGLYTVGLTGTTLSPGPSQTFGIGAGASYTTLAYQRDGVVYSATFNDNVTAPAAGFFSLSIANISVDAGPLDVYLLAAGTNPTTSNAAPYQNVQSLSLPGTFTAGTFDVVVTAASNPADVRLRMNGQVFATAQPYLLALTSTPGGALVNGVLVPQGISVPASAFVAASSARIRVISALQNAQVAVTAGTTALAPVIAPAHSNYATIAAGTGVTAITATDLGTSAVANVASLPAGTLVAGNDYTLLVYGTNSAPLAALLTDTNQTATPYANVRVINAAVNGAGAGVTLVIDGVQVATGVHAGTASGYIGVTPGATVSATSAGNAISVLGVGATIPQQTFALKSGGVYTIFVDTNSTMSVIADRS
jgi:hypothetical protein